MKLHPVRLILACAALATGAVATAQTFDAAADQERRTRNREEALVKYHAQQDRLQGNSATSRERSSAAGGPTLGDRARGAAKSVRGFTHRQAEKARDFSERQDRRWGNKNSADRQATNRNKQRGTPD